METITHVSLELLGLPVEGIHDLPDGHGDDVDGDQGANNQVQLRIFHNLRIKIQQNEPILNKKIFLHINAQKLDGKKLCF